MAREKYKEFLNYLHNELKITREDIREWTKEAVEEVAVDYVNHHFAEKTLDDRIKSIVTDFRYGGKYDIKSDIKNRVAKELADHLEIVVKEEEA